MIVTLPPEKRELLFFELNFSKELQKINILIVNRLQKIKAAQRALISLFF